MAEYFTRYSSPSDGRDVLYMTQFPAFKEITNEDVEKYQNNDDYFYFIIEKRIKFTENFDISKIKPENNKYLLFLHGYYYLLNNNFEFAAEYFKKSSELGYDFIEVIKNNSKFILFLLNK